MENPTIKREPTEHIKTFDGKKEFMVSMVQFNNRLIIASNLNVYEVVGSKLKKIELIQGD